MVKHRINDAFTVESYFTLAKKSHDTTESVLKHTDIIWILDLLDVIDYVSKKYRV